MVRFFQCTETDDEQCNLKKLADIFRPTLVLWEFKRNGLWFVLPLTKSFDMFVSLCVVRAFRERERYLVSVEKKIENSPQHNPVFKGVDQEIIREPRIYFVAWSNGSVLELLEDSY